jgi:hypothetical protein
MDSLFRSFPFISINLDNVFVFSHSVQITSAS